MSMSEKLIDFFTHLMGDRNAANFLFLSGIWGFFVLHILMPLRIFWHIYIVAKREKLNVGSVRYCMAIILLAFSFLGVCEIWYAVATAGPASGAGILLPMLLISPLIVYLMYEIMIFNLKDTRKILNV